MIKNLEQNYISVVLVINDDNSQVERKIEKIKKVLDDNFKSSEIVIVDNTAKVDSLESLKSLNFKHTEIKLPIKHRTQQALNAGTAIAIGDYIIEIEDISFDIDYNKIIEMYRKSQEGYDFVFLTPKKSRSSYIVVDMDYKNNRGFSENLMLMFDTLIYYTDAIMLFTQRLAFGFFILFGLGVIYSIITKIVKETVEGWASLFIILSLGFFGIFFILSIVIRYLHHILQNSLNTKDYIYRSVDKK